LICIKLSSTILRKNNKKVGIYSNIDFIKLLKNNNVELDFYHEIEEGIGKLITHNFFALSKIYTSSQQTEPFILLDVDMILFDNFKFEEYEQKQVFYHYPECITFLSSNLLLSEKYHIDEDILKYQSSHDSFNNWKDTYMNQFYMLSDICISITNEKNFTPIVAYNCAMYGGQDWKTISTVNNNILDFIITNYKKINDTIDYPMTTLEQMLVVSGLISFGYKINEMEFLTKWNEFTIIHNDNDVKVNYDNLNFVFNWDKTYEEISNPNFLNLITHQFNGHLHLSRSKYTIGVRNLIYNMLKYYDQNYVEWFESNKYSKLDFQEKIY
jgi:hypothetical protein